MIFYRPQPKLDKPATLILLTQEQVKQNKYPFSNAAISKAIKELNNTGQFLGKTDQNFPLLINKKIVFLVGLGKANDISLTAVRVAVKEALESAYLKPCKSLEIIVHQQKDDAVKAVIEGVLIGTYVWKKYLTRPGSADKKDIVLVAPSKPIYEETVKITEGTNLTRDLVNENADIATSVFFEKTVRKLIKGKKNISIEVLNEKQMKSKGLGLHLAVNQGSCNEPKLIIVKYKGAPVSEGYTALIGKGMTFDTGGLNLKQTGHIETMRIDMGGAAAVAGVLKNAISLKLKKNIVFAFSIAENVTGSASYKPGDVLKSYAGKTVEVLNTDAEGRLVLADAIAYITKNYKPRRIIDIATLTGACVVALGLDYTGLVSTNDRLAGQLLHSAEETDDRAWRLPSYPELKVSVKSKIADICNLGSPRGVAGVLTAAEFLRQFVDETTTEWAHLDIAGTSFVDNTQRQYFAHGATGAGVRLLTHYLKNN